MFDDNDVFEEPIRNGRVAEWYKKLDAIIEGTYKSKLTEKQKEERLKLAKVGKYREWEFDIKRYHEILAEVIDRHSEKMYKAGINYYRKNYSEAKLLTDEEIIVKGLYKQLYVDCQKDSKEKRDYYKELEKKLYSGELL